MKRRDFLAASGLAGAAAMADMTLVSAQESSKPKQQLLELRVYHMLPGGRKKVLNDFLKDAALPALGRLGVGPIGVFEPVHGADSLTLYTLTPYSSFDTLLSTSSKLMADPEFQKASEAFYKAPIDEPPYARIESSLMLAFEHLPKVEASQLATDKKPRIFEMRIYESHNGKVAKRKVEMFNSGGEIEIFKRTGLQPVFFGETIVGPRMPNLTYMVVFPDNAAREKAWDGFRNDPDWKKISTDSYYADTVSNITDMILRPTAYSQL